MFRSDRRDVCFDQRTEHICSLGSDPSQEWTGVISLAMHPDGKRILSGAQGRREGSTILRLWDVEAKRCIRSFVGHSRYADTVCFSAGCAVSQAWEENDLRIWDLTCRYSIEINLGAGKHAASNEEVFMPNLGGEDGVIIDAMNIHTGIIRSSHDSSSISSLQFESVRKVVPSGSSTLH
jgi:WD40 repeat protein